MFSPLDIGAAQIKTTLRHHFTPAEGYHQQTNKQTKKENNKCGGNMDKLEPSGIAKENAERHCHCGRPFSRFQKLKTESPCDPAGLFLGIFPEDAEAETNRQCAHQCSQKRSQRPTSGDSPGSLDGERLHRVRAVHTVGRHQPEKERDSHVSCNMDDCRKRQTQKDKHL